MKHKKRFPGKLWPFGKEKDLPPYISYFPGSSRPPVIRSFWDDYKIPIIIFIIGVIVLIVNAVSYGQSAKSVALKHGEEVPDIKINDILNSPERSVSISDYKDKLLILDFWFTGCGTCVEDMPAVAALQKQFGDKIKIIEIDLEKPETVLKFYRYHPREKNLGLPVACNDILLRQLFPHIYCPHVVWIDHGIFIAATADDYLIAKNIDSILNKKSVPLTTKTDREHWDFKQPLFQTGNTTGLTSSTKIYGAILSGFIADIGSGGRLKTDSTTGDQRFEFLNYPVLNFYGQILQSGLPLIANRRILQVADRTRYLNEGHEYDDVWNAKHCYSFEAIVPKSVSHEQIFLQMKSLVDSELGVSGTIEKVNTDVLVLRFQHRIPHPSKYKKPENQSFPGLPMYFHNTTVKDLVDGMNEKETMLPVVDETETYGQVHIDLAYPTMPEDEESWRKALKANGLDLVRCKRKIQMFILRENPVRPTLSPKGSLKLSTN